MKNSVIANKHANMNNLSSHGPPCNHTAPDHASGECRTEGYCTDVLHNGVKFIAPTFIPLGQLEQHKFSIMHQVMQGMYIQWLCKSSLWPCNHSNVCMSGITYLHNILSGTHCVASPSMCLKTGKEGSMCMWSLAAVALYSALHSIVRTYIAPVHYLL